MKFLLPFVTTGLPIAAVFLLASVPTQAQSTFYSSRAAFLAHTTGTTTLDFEGLAPDNGSTNYPLPAGYTQAGVNFGVNTALFHHQLLFVAGKGSHYPGNSVFSSQNTQANTPGEIGDLLITFSTPVTAIGLDFGDNFISPNTDTFTLSNGETFTRTTGSGTNFNFVGLTSLTPITSLDIQEPRDFVLNIDNFTFGVAVPEAATAVSLGFLLLMGGVSLCAAKRRTAGRE